MRPISAPFSAKTDDVRDQLAVGVEGAAAHKVRLMHELGTVAGLKGLLDGCGVGKGFRRHLQPVDSARVVADPNADRSVQTRVRVADLAPGRHLAERP